MVGRAHNKDPEQLTPLTPAVFHILLALSDGAMHGYAIMQAVGTATDPEISMGPGTIYGSIQRMERSGLVEECGMAADGKRRLFDLTPVGRKALEVESSRIARLAEMVRAKGLVPQEA
ncbi:MAG: PadR family transcriptional regulator [Longimicrobiales bacterium]|nr:PadR family transcriptional regulator [Longimicrobiales bacterium]